MDVGVLDKEAAVAPEGGKLERHQCKERVFDTEVKLCHSHTDVFYFTPQATAEPRYIINCLNKY